MPIVREPDGLAMSSRNRYLSRQEREKALSLYKTLKNRKITKKIDGVKLEYFVAVDKNTLKPVKKIKRGTVIAIAGHVGKTRLIDNIIV
jgi:pantoate--beta-alanine ligase